MNRRSNRDQGTKPELGSWPNALADIGISGRFGYRICGLTLRELGIEDQGMGGPAVSKVVARMEHLLQRDRDPHLRDVAKKPETIMSYAQT